MKNAIRYRIQQLCQNLLLCFLLYHQNVVSIQDEDSNLRSDLESENTVGEKAIVNGVEVEKGRYPYMVLLRNLDRVTCGGTLVHPEWVLSAAHCAGRFNNALIGAHNQDDIDEDSVEIIKINYEIFPPDYESFLTGNDIMMIKLRKPSTFDTINVDAMKAVNPPPGTDVTVMGWGTIGVSSPPSNVLLEVELDVLTNEQCGDRFANKITDDMICATRRRNGACQGDSGGPLIIKGSQFEEDVQIGVVSFSGGCEIFNGPTVFSRVSKHYDFIKSTIVNNPGPFICHFPEDEFNYTECNVEYPCWIGDKICDSGPYNTLGCNFDAGDCNCEFPQELLNEDDFNYTNCTVESPCRLGDGFCDEDYNVAECNFDANDCFFTNCDSFPDDGFNYSDCTQANSTPCAMGDGFCDIAKGLYTAECNFDKGDCDFLLAYCPFPDDGRDYTECTASLPCFVGNGMCNSQFDNDECHSDGGDCRLPSLMVQLVKSIFNFILSLVNFVKSLFIFFLRLF